MIYLEPVKVRQAEGIPFGDLKYINLMFFEKDI